MNRVTCNNYIKLVKTYVKMDSIHDFIDKDHDLKLYVNLNGILFQRIDEACSTIDTHLEELREKLIKEFDIDFHTSVQENNHLRDILFNIAVNLELKDNFADLFINEIRTKILKFRQ